MAIFVKYGDFKGETTAEGYKDWIECSSYQWGVGRGISSGVGGGSKREASAPSVSEMTFTKSLDSADVPLLKEAVGGKAVTVKVELTQTDNAGSHVAFQKYVLTNALISGYSLSSGGDRPSVSFSINFTKFDSSYWAIDDKFSSKNVGNVIYDLSTAKSG
jgi:type VI secretion system secreted protein Hcp